MNISEIIWRVNWIDVIIVILLIRIGYAGFDRGLGSEVIPTIGIYTALIIASYFYARLGEFISEHTPITSSYSNPLSFIAIVILLRYIFIIIETVVVGKIISVHIASIYDRIGGLAIGIIRAVLLVSVVLIALELIPFEYVKYSLKEKSLMGSRFLDIGHAVYNRTAAFLKVEE